jgi:hypothetical protein
VFVMVTPVLFRHHAVRSAREPTAHFTATDRLGTR